MDRESASQLDRGWNFNASTANESTLKPLCQQVEKHFQLPARRLYRYFAAAEDDSLRAQYGSFYRGFHIPLSGRNALPNYLRDCFFRPPEELAWNPTFDEMVAFDNLIYIRDSTCLDMTGFAITYAHELQHFMQYGHTPKLWAVNSVLYWKLGGLEPTATAIDIPYEREANIVSKRVAEAVCGAEAVRRFAEEQIRSMGKAGEAEQEVRWLFFRDVPALTKYDLTGRHPSVRTKIQGPARFWNGR